MRRQTATPQAAARRRPTATGHPTGGLLVPAVLIGLVACGVLAVSLIGRDERRGGRDIATRAVAVSGQPTVVAAAGGRLWTLDGPSRRLGSVERTGSPPGGTVVVSGPSTVGVDLAPDGDGVWVAVVRAGSADGRVTRFGPAGRGRTLEMPGVAPRRIAVLPGFVLALGSARLGSFRRDGRRAWARRVPAAVDVAVGYGSVWTVARTGSGSVLRRWSPSGRSRDVRRVAGAVTAVAVGRGAVWLANGCPGGVARAPVPAGPLTCRRIGSGFSDVAVGAGGVWAADLDGRRVVRLSPETGAVEASAPLPSGPAGLVADGDAVWALTRGGGVFSLTPPEDPDTTSAQGPGSSL